MKIQENRVSNTLIAASLVVTSLIAIVPLLAVVAISITPYGEVIRNGGYVFFPREVSFDSYGQILGNPNIRRALVLTTFVTVVGTIVNMVLTTLAAYPLSRHHNLPARRGLTLAFLFTFVFSAGIVPTFLVVQATGLVDTVWAMIIPNAISVFNVLIMKTFFDGLPVEVIEAARIDGASELHILGRIVLPLSVPVMLTLGLFYAVGHWNTFYLAVFYVRDSALYPLQLVIHNMLAASQSVENPDSGLPALTLQMTAVVVAAVPMILVYPFIQRHFQKGVLIGAVKD